MPGGPWTPAAPPVRPGLYVNFISDAIAAVSAGERGRLAQIVRGGRGNANSATVLDSFADLVNYIGTNETSPYNAYFAGRQGFVGGARQQRFYRIMGAGHAAATIILQDTTGAPVNAIRFDAKDHGTFGNGISVQSRANPGDNTKTDLLLTVASVLVATWTSSVNRGSAGHMQNLVDLVNADASNYWITASFLAAGNNTPASATLALAGGNEGSAPVLADYVSLLDTVGLEADEWDTFTVDVKNSDIAGIEAILRTWFIDLRNDGNRVSMFLGSGVGETDTTAESTASAINHEGIQYAHPGAYLTNNAGALTLYRGAAMAAQLAGIRASLPLGRGMTNYPLQEVVSLERKIKGTTVDLLIKNGVTVLGKAGINFITVKGVTTLVVPGVGLDGKPIPQGFKKVSIVNTTDAIAAAIELAARTNYVGIVPNDEDGQSAILGVVRDFLRVMSGQRAIRNNYTVDLSQTQASEGERMYIDMTMTVVDTIDVILITAKIGS
jgi:hypothetical protein